MARQLRLTLKRPTSYARDTFVPSPTNAEARAALDAWPAWPEGRLALVGPAGTGKTHLGRDWAQRVGAARLTVRDPDLAALRGRPVLVEDADRGPLAEEALFHLINMAGVDGGSLLLTARSAPAVWPVALPDLRSRLNALSVAQLGEPDDLVLEGVLRKAFRERNIKPAEDVYPYLMRRIPRSVPEALAVVERLDEAADAEGKAISRVLARQILEIDDDTLELFE